MEVIGSKFMIKIYKLGFIRNLIFIYNFLEGLKYYVFGKREFMFEIDFDMLVFFCCESIILRIKLIDIMLYNLWKFCWSFLFNYLFIG